MSYDRDFDIIIRLCPNRIERPTTRDRSIPIRIIIKRTLPFLVLLFRTRRFSLLRSVEFPFSLTIDEFG